MARAFTEAAISTGQLNARQGELVLGLYRTRTAEGAVAGSTGALSKVFAGLKATIVAHPFLAAAAAITAVAVAVDRYHKKMQQARQDTVDHGREAKKEADNLISLRLEYEEANAAYDGSEESKKNLEDATNKLLEALGLERDEVGKLRRGYDELSGSMDNVINKTMASALQEKRYDLEKAVVAAEDKLTHNFGRNSTTIDFGSTGLDLFRVMQENGALDNNTVRFTGTRPNIVLNGDTNTPEGIIEAVNNARELLDAADTARKTLGMTTRELYDTVFWKDLTAYINRFKDDIKGLDESQEGLKDVVVTQKYLENYSVPESIDEFYNLRDAMIEASKGEEVFNNSIADIVHAVDKFLLDKPFSGKLSSEIDSFSLSLDGLSEHIRDRIQSGINNEDIDIASNIRIIFGNSNYKDELEEWTNIYGYSIDDIIAHCQKLREEISKPAEDAGKAAAKTNKEYEKFKKNVKSLRIDIVKALGQGVELSEEQNEVFLRWKDSLGYTKDQLEEIYKLFQMMYKETPASDITAKTVGDRVRDAREAFEQEQLWLAEAEERVGDIDLNQTQFGNINMDNRQFLEWTEENLEKYKDIIESYGQTVDDYAGTISTVLGGWDEFSDGSGTIPIAFSPMLQTESGEPELLTDEVIHKYINTLIKKADEEAQKAGKAGWTNEILFDLDAEGVEVDGKRIKGIIAAVGDEAERVAEIMHFVGSGGSIQLALKELGDAYNEANAFAHYYILDDVGDLLTLQDEIKKAGVEWERYQKILEQGDPEDLAGNISDAVEKAVKDIELGRIDAPSVWGAAKLLFSDDKLANELGYDLNKIAAELNSGFIKALFGKPENEEEVADYAARISNYLIENADKMKSVELIQNPDRGTFQFWYTSLEELADDMGLSEAATTSLLKALDAYGVEMMMSGKEMQQYINDYRSLISMTHNAEDALEQLVTEMAQQGVWEPHALQALQQLRDAGVISGDDSEFIETIKRVYKTVEETDNLEMHPEVYLDRDQEVRDQAAALWEYLESTLSKEIHTTVVLDQVAGEVADDHEASGTLNAPGGVTLVNEKGPELISDNGQAYIANGGKPGFTILSRGAIVFNAEETKDIFRRGYPNKPMNAYADGTGNTVNKASLRERLISGKRVSGLYTGGVSKVFTCGNCGHQWNYSPIDYPNGPTGYCPKCGAQIVNGQTYGGNTVDPSHSNDDYYPYNVSTGEYISDYDSIYDDYSYSVRNDYKSCPNCGSRFGVEYEICPYCGYNFHTGRMPRAQTQATINPYNTLAPGSPNRSTAKTGGSSGYTGGGGGGSVGHANYESEKDPEKVDWIAVLLNRIQRGVAALEKIASSGFKQLTTRLKAATEEVKGLNKEIAAQQDAYGRYLAEAESVGLSSDLAALVQSGQIDISEYDDETRELIDKYTEWYNTCHFMRQRILTIVFNCWNTLRAFQLQHTDEICRSANA